MKEAIIISLMILLNLSFFQVFSANTILAEDNSDLVSKLQKRAATNEQKKSLDVKNSEALITKKLEGKLFAPKMQSDNFNLGKGLQKNSKQEKLNYVPREILVKYRNNKINLQTISGRATASNFISSRSLEKKEDLRKNNISVLRIKDSKTVEQKIAELKSYPSIEYAEPNYRRYPADINTNDTSRGLLWGLDNIGQSANTVSGSSDADIDAPEAWAINEGTNASVVVAVIDSGVAYNHPDLVANMWNGTNCKDESGNALGGCNHGYDYEDDDKIPLPTTSSHGTHIAGIIAAVKNNNKGVIGVAPQAKIMAIKYADDIASEIKAIDFAIQNGAKVINASFSGVTFSQSEFDAINRFKTAGGIFVAAAGNQATNNESTHRYPSDYNLDNIISVAATNQSDVLASFSNYGITSVDVGAPGGEHPNPKDGVIYSTVADTNYLSEDFDGVVPPSIGNKFTQDLDSTWGTIKSGDNTFIASDYANWGSYQNNVYSRLYSPIISLNGKLNSYLNFFIGCSTEPEYDSLGLWFYNGLTWELIDTFSGEVMEAKNYNLSNYANPNFRFRFTWLTDLNVNSTGCLLDDISVDYYSDGSDEKYGWKDGTSMAAPHVAGLVALIEGYNPNLTASQVKNTILTTGDSLASLSGKTVSGKRINAYKALNSLSEKKPPYAVAIDNQKDARPVSGVNEADVVYEFPVEGSITRLMAIYNPDSGVDPSVVIGPVRSARPYFARTASEHGAIYAHAGGSTAALRSLTNHEYNLYNLEALATDGESYFWRDNSRAMPHNLYTSIEQLNNFREDIYLTGGTFTNPWIFSDNPSLLSDIGFSQGTVIVNYENVNYNVKWSYNESDRLYYRQTYENGSYVDYLDKNNNRVFASNLAIQYTATDAATELIKNEGEALLCREGNCIDGKWRKNSTDDNIKFYINNGNDEFDFKTGKLWVHVTNYSATLPDSAHTISGTIKYYDGVKVIPNATVILENSIGAQIATAATDVNGAYQFAGVASGGDYTVRVSKDDNFSSTGVTVSDLITIKKHTLGTELTDIYKKIAADFNSSLSITVSDLIMLKKFTLERVEGRPASSWKFYSSNTTLTAANYLTVGLNRSYTNLTTDTLNQDFIGIKMGDVNNTWASN